MQKPCENNRNWHHAAAFLLVGACAAISSGCGGYSSGPAGPPSLTSIAVSPANVSISPGLTQQFKATGTYSDSSTKDLTGTAMWSSSAMTVATVSASGLASGMSTGTATISASSGTISGSTTLTVSTLASQLIQHVVIIFQENRTPDNLFQGLPGADIATSGLNSAGQMVPLTPEPLANNYDLDHSHFAFLTMYDNGKMDGADKVRFSCAPTAVGCPPPNPQFKYVNPADVIPYVDLAKQYTFGDRMFQTNQGPSFPAHQFIIAGTSAPDDGTRKLFASENPVVPPNVPATAERAGCMAPTGTTVALIDPSGSEATTQYPCFEHPTLIDSLDAQKIDWRYYAPSAVGLSIWVGPDAIQHIRTGSDWSKVVLNQTQVLTDIANGQLTQVSWVIPTGQASDHANGNDGSGPSWVASIVNAIGNSPYWLHTAIIITWDDWGGWYDHVPPPSIANQYEYGFRVPLIVVSPYAKRGYVSKVNHDFGSILRYIEGIFKLPSLGYADARADDLSDCFDFTQVPPPFAPIAARLKAQDFLNDKSIPLPPDDDDQ